jgi:hypothetical protein
MAQDYGHIHVKRDDERGYTDISNMEFGMMMETRKPTNHSFLKNEDDAVKLERLDHLVEPLKTPDNRIRSYPSCHKIIWYLQIISLLGLGILTEYLAITDLQHANQYTHELMENCAQPSEEVPSSVSQFNLAIFRVALGMCIILLGMYKGCHY